MNPSRIFILRPVATSLLMVAILLAGIIGFNFLPISALPQVDYPTIQVQTFYPGASPDVMATSVTAPLEQQFGQMPGLNQMSSVSSAGASVVTLQFDLSLSLDIAEQEVQAAINASNNLLPTDLPTPPIYAKVNPADAPILTIAVTSKSLAMTKVQDLTDTRIAQKISQLPGVGLVSLSGGQKPAVRVRFNPTAMASFGLSYEDLRTAISNANVNTPKGSFDGVMRAYSIDANDQLKSADEYKDIVIIYKNGAPIRLSDVATIEDSAENTKLGAWHNKTPAIILNVQRQPGANVIAVVDNIQKIMPEIKAALPSGIEVSVLTDRTTTIRASVDDVEFELILSVGLVVMVIFLFLRNIPATIIPSLSVPLSLVGTFAIMNLAGYSLNNLSLMALTIATGFVVDDAIVMIENISRYVEEGEPPLQAALKGASQIGFTIISLTVSLLAVLIPLLFMGDVIGRLFREFAVTLAVTIIISAIVSLTLVPMLCARLLHFRKRNEASAFERYAEDKFNALLDLYRRGLVWVLDRQKATLYVAVGTVFLTMALYVLVPKGFFPIQDTGLIQGITSAPATISYEAMAARQQAIADILLKDKDVESLSSFIGVDGTNTTLNMGRIGINLVPHEKRSASAVKIIRRLQNAVATIPGITLYMQPTQDLTVDTKVSPTQYQFMVEDANTDELNLWMPKLLERLRKLPELADVASDYQDRGLTQMIMVNRDVAAKYGLSLAAIDNALYDAFGQRIISTIFTQSSQYRVILEANVGAIAHQATPLDSIYLPTTSGKPIPLSAIATIKEAEAPLMISHLGQFPAALVSFNLGQGYALGDAVDVIEKAMGELAVPKSLEMHFQGAAQAFHTSLSSELLLILAAIITMYIVLGILYESYIHPITILSTLPSAGVGALLALWGAGEDLGIIGIIGIILLIGIVKKNAIMMIDFALYAERVEHKPAREAIFQACLLRFRPIMMTTMAALLGALPLMLGTGVGSELRHPLGISIVGGLIISQFLTLFTTPVIYLAFDRLGQRLGLDVSGARAIEEEPEA